KNNTLEVRRSADSRVRLTTAIEPRHRQPLDCCSLKREQPRRGDGEESFGTGTHNVPNTFGYRHSLARWSQFAKVKRLRHERVFSQIKKISIGVNRVGARLFDDRALE